MDTKRKLVQIAQWLLGILQFTSAIHAYSMAAHRNYDFQQTQPLARQWIVTHYGDSIAAGYCGIGCTLDSYAQYFAFKNESSVARSQGVNIIGRIRATTGHKAEDISREIDENSLDARLSDIITVEACGNDYLPSRQEFKTSCDPRTIEKALDSCKSNITDIINKLVLYAHPGARIRMMNMYYPGLLKDEKQKCHGKMLIDYFLPILVEGNWYTCNYAHQYHIACVDAFALMNSADEDQAKIAWIPGETLESYQTRLLVTYRHLLSDPSQKKTSNGVISLIQSDDIHPNSIGHQKLGLLHHLAGYASSK